MTHPSATSAPSPTGWLRPSRGLVGVQLAPLALIGQAIVIGAAFLAGRVAGAGSGEPTLGAVVGPVLVGEALR
jgi:hypothetical protein